MNLKDGTFSGHVYSANCGWISLSNAVAFGQTDFLLPGLDKDSDGITDAWELTYTNTLTAFMASSDTDGDGVPDLAEHLADTNPTDPADKLMIAAYETTSGGTEATLTWLSKLTRCYQIEKTLNLTGPTWLDSGLGLIASDEPTTTRMFADTNAPMRFYRVKAMKPFALEAGGAWCARSADRCACVSWFGSNSRTRLSELQWRFRKRLRQRHGFEHSSTVADDCGGWMAWLWFPVLYLHFGFGVVHPAAAGLAFAATPRFARGSDCVRVSSHSWKTDWSS